MKNIITSPSMTPAVFESKIFAMESPEYESKYGTPNIMIAYIDPRIADFVTPKRFLCGTHKMNGLRLIVQ